MNKKDLWRVSIFIITAFFLSACVGSVVPPTAEEPIPAEESAVEEALAEEEPAQEGPYQIPNIEDGKYNVAFVYVDPHDDGGWSQAHDVGRIWVEENVDNVHTAYVESVAEGADAEQVIRSLASKGFDVIFTTSFGYMDASEIVAAEFLDVDIIHIGGFKSNESNFGNLTVAMDTMKYFSGMLAGSRAKADDNPKLGYIATYPFPEEFRSINAFAIGVQKTCSECSIDISFLYAWNDVILEQEAALTFFDNDVQVVTTNTRSSSLAQVTPDGKWSITNDYEGSCAVDTCLTSTYWNWGPIYARIIEESRDGEWQGGSEYFDAESGGIGLFGFMAGETPQPGVNDIPAEDLDLIESTLEDMLEGKFSRFDVFKGPIVDNEGNLVLKEDETLDELDLGGFAQFGSECQICMYWWNENIISELPNIE